MEFEWDDAKEESNRNKHGLDFRTAAKVFPDPFAIEFEDDRSLEEMRWNIIGVVEGRVLCNLYGA